MNFRSIANHSAKDTTLVNPAKFVSSAPYELNKAAFRKWCLADDTDHAFLSMVDGVNPHKRVSGDNPPQLIRGFMADYDAPAHDDIVKRLKESKKVRYMPTHVIHSQSGNFRLLWEFAEAIYCPPDSVAAFMDRMAKVLNVLMLFPGYDSTSSTPSQTFEFGKSWECSGDALPMEIATETLFKVLSHRLPTEAVIPIEALANEVADKFPGRWTRPFELGARGPLFWVDDGIQRDGCVVCEDGMLCFSDRGGQGFLSWAEIFGSNFVKDYDDQKLSNVGSDLYYDGKRYYEFDARGRVFGISKDDLILRFKDIGLSSKKSKKARLSEVEQALLWVQKMHRIHVVAPILHDHNTVVEINGIVVLNNRTIRPTQPASDGDPSKWPWLHAFYESFFDPHDGLEPKDFFFAWLQRAYVAMLKGRLLSGQAVIIVGPTGKGKTLNSNVIVGGLLGGAVTASEFLQSKSIYNRELSENPVWAIDDATAPPNGLELLKFTENIKRYVANPSIELRAMYQDPQRVPFGGRIMITLNPDPNSLGLIPALDQSNRDKLMAFKIADGHQPDFPPNHKLEELITAELPHFARWLLDWEPPVETIGESRFGVQSIFHPEVIDAARDNSSRSAALEAIELFATTARDVGLVPNNGTVWKGTTTDLISAFGELDALRNLTISRNYFQIQRGLSQAEESYVADPEHNRPVSSTSSGRGKRWVIDIAAEHDDHEHDVG